MIKINLGLAKILVLLTLMSCSNKSDGLSPYEKANYRKIAYNYLYSNNSAPINISPNKSKIEFGKYSLINNTNFILMNNSNKISFFLNNENINLKNDQGLVAVSFYTNTVQDELLGPSIVIIEPITQQVIGIVPQN